MEFVRLFLIVLLVTLGIPTLCGLAVGLCSFVFRKLCGRGFGYAAVVATSVIGTPIHELSHALMCLAFCHRIESICLFDPGNGDGRIGYVEHSYRKGNPYAVLGNWFIGIAPVVFGGAVVLLLLRFVFPETYFAYLSVSSAVAAGQTGIGEFFGELFPLVGRMYGASPCAWYLRVGAIVLMFSVSLHVSLSKEDLCGSARALPWLIAIIAAIAGVCVLLGGETASAVSDAMIRFACMSGAMFCSVLVCALILDASALVIFLIRLLFSAR